MKFSFIDKRFRSDTLSVIDQANTIIDEYRQAGFILTLRQLYYQFVARALIENRQSEYKRLGSIVNDGRLAGLIDWSAIEDRTRNLQSHSAWASPAAIIRSAARSYARDPWLEQDAYAEIWIEKDALVGVIEPACDRWRIPYFACRGYTSQSEQFLAGERLANARDRGKRPVIFHLGDHDPSGLDMTRDNHDRLVMFSLGDVEVIRLALNADQIAAYNPPPNPAKDTDARFEGYRAEHGDESWELDALDPQVIDRLIDDAVSEIIDMPAWDADMSEETTERSELEEAASRWDDIADALRNNKL